MYEVTISRAVNAVPFAQRHLACSAACRDTAIERTTPPRYEPTRATPFAGTYEVVSGRGKHRSVAEYPHGGYRAVRSPARVTVGPATIEGPCAECGATVERAFKPVRSTLEMLGRHIPQSA